MIEVVVFAAIALVWIAYHVLLRGPRNVVVPTVSVISDRFCPPGEAYFGSFRVNTRTGESEPVFLKLINVS